MIANADPLLTDQGGAVEDDKATNFNLSLRPGNEGRPIVTTRTSPNLHGLIQTGMKGCKSIGGIQVDVVFGDHICWNAPGVPIIRNVPEAILAFFTELYQVLPHVVDDFSSVDYPQIRAECEIVLLP